MGRAGEGVAGAPEGRGRASAHPEKGRQAPGGAAAGREVGKVGLRGRWGRRGDGSQENRTWAPSRPGPHRGAASTSKGGAGRGDVRRRSPERGRDAGPEPTRLLAHARGGAAPRRPGGSESAQATNLIHAAGPGGGGVGAGVPSATRSPVPGRGLPTAFPETQRQSLLPQPDSQPGQSPTTEVTPLRK